MKADAIVMHPLPRGPELDPRVDEDPRATYWRQERNGMWVRAALLIRVLGVESRASRAVRMRRARREAAAPEGAPRPRTTPGPTPRRAAVRTGVRSR